MALIERTYGVAGVVQFAIAKAQVAGAVNVPNKLVDPFQKCSFLGCCRSCFKPQDFVPANSFLYGGLPVTDACFAKLTRCLPLPKPVPLYGHFTGCKE